MMMWCSLVVHHRTEVPPVKPTKADVLFRAALTFTLATSWGVAGFDDVLLTDTWICPVAAS